MNKSSSGFTLIELIIYLSLISLIIGSLVLFSWDSIYSRVKSENQIHLDNSLRFANKRLNYEIRNASDILAFTASSVCLSNTDPARNPTLISLSSNRISIGWGGGSANCTSLTNSSFLTPEDIVINNFLISAFDTQTKNVSYSYTATLNSTRSEWQVTQEASSTAELRSL